MFGWCDTSRTAAKRNRRTIAIVAIETKQDPTQKLTAAYRAFLEEQQPSKKEVAGYALIRAIFGEDAITVDPKI